MKLWTNLLCMAVGMAVFASHAVADTAAEMLEKGIYNEETVGNLDEAIRIYREVLDVASETERLAAQAQFRLGQCLLKQQKKDEAIKAFETLITKYPDQTELVAKAKQHLPDEANSTELPFAKAPWKDGERLTLTMRLAGGQAIGIVGLGVNSGKLDGRDVWNMSVRRFVAGGVNEGVSLVTVDKSTNLPITTNFDHTVLSSSSAVWYDDKVVISAKDKAGKTTVKEVEFKPVAYSNDQVLFGMRQLPLAVGYKVTIPIRVAFTGGNALGFELEVDKKETIKTPVGDFDCFRVDTTIGQTFWIADVPERYVVRFVAGGVTATLSSISTDEAASTLENDKLGFSLTVPKGWFYVQGEPSNPDNTAGYQLVAPSMASAVISVKDKSLLDDDDRASLDVWAESKIDRGKRRYKDFKLRTDSQQETQFAGADATSFVVDYDASGVALAEGITLALAESKAVAFAATSRASDFETYREQFDAIRDSVTLR